MSNRLLLLLFSIANITITHLYTMQEEPKKPEESKSLLLMIDDDSCLDKENILKFFEEHKNIEALDIHDCDQRPRLKDQVLTWIIEQCPSLKTLTLHRCFKISYEAIQKIGAYKRLTFMSIVGNKNITRENIAELRKNYPSLKINFKEGSV